MDAREAYEKTKLGSLVEFQTDLTYKKEVEELKNHIDNINKKISNNVLSGKSYNLHINNINMGVCGDSIYNYSLQTDYWQALIKYYKNLNYNVKISSNGFGISWDFDNYDLYIKKC